MKKKGHNPSCFLKVEHKTVTHPNPFPFSRLWIRTINGGWLQWISVFQIDLFFIWGQGQMPRCPQSAAHPERAGGKTSPDGGTGCAACQRPPATAPPPGGTAPLPTCVRGRALGPRSPRRRLPGRQQRQHQQPPRRCRPPRSRPHLAGSEGGRRAGGDRAGRVT